LTKRHLNTQEAYAKEQYFNRQDWHRKPTREQ